MKYEVFLYQKDDGTFEPSFKRLYGVMLVAHEWVSFTGSYQRKIERRREVFNDAIDRLKAGL